MFRHRKHLSGSCHVDAWAGLKICVCVCNRNRCCAFFASLAYCAKSLADCHLKLRILIACDVLSIRIRYNTVGILCRIHRRSIR